MVFWHDHGAVVLSVFSKHQYDGDVKGAGGENLLVWPASDTVRRLQMFHGEVDKEEHLFYTVIYRTNVLTAWRRERNDNSVFWDYTNRE